MRHIRVNADYESVLFHSRPGPASVNQSLEFLAFFLTQDSILTSKIYSSEYLDYVSTHTGHRPRFVSNSSQYHNWWGALKDIPLEQWWNSKITSAEFLIEKSWIEGLRILLPGDEGLLDTDKSYLLKDPYLMSGQKFQIKGPGDSVNWNGHQKLLAEPLLKRIWDFSVYVFPSGKKIFYRNLVDGKFQYRGTIFSNWKNPELELLSFYNSVKASNWTIYRERLEEIILHYSRFPNDVGYSVDGFVYQVESDLRIHPLCEVNYRRTMGRIAFELAELYSGEAQWLGMFLVKPRPVPAWTLLKERLDVFALSPGDTRFEVILIKAENEREARNKIQELNELLPHSQAAIDF